VRSVSVRLILFSTEFFACAVNSSQCLTPTCRCHSALRHEIPLSPTHTTKPQRSVLTFSQFPLHASTTVF
jgi:hypothetical protein